MRPAYLFLVFIFFLGIPLAATAEGTADDTSDDAADDVAGDDTVDDNQFLDLEQNGNNVCVTIRIGAGNLETSYLLIGGNDVLLEHYVFDPGDAISQDEGVATFMLTDYCIPTGTREYDLYFYDDAGSIYQLAKDSIEITETSDACDQDSEEACPNSIDPAGGADAGDDDDDAAGCGGCGVSPGADAAALTPLMLIIGIAAVFLTRRKT